jgi:hypothetical protein
VPHYGVTGRARWKKFALRLQLQLFAKLLLKLANPKRFDIGFSRVPHHEIYRTPRVA